MNFLHGGKHEIYLCCRTCWCTFAHFTILQYFTIATRYASHQILFGSCSLLSIHIYFDSTILSNQRDHAIAYPPVRSHTTKFSSNWPRALPIQQFCNLSISDLIILLGRVKCWLRYLKSFLCIYMYVKNHQLLRSVLIRNRTARFAEKAAIPTRVTISQARCPDTPSYYLCICYAV